MRFFAYASSLFARARYYSAALVCVLALASVSISSASDSSWDSTFVGPLPSAGEKRAEEARQLLRDKHPAAKSKILAKARAETQPGARAQMVGALINLKPGTITADELKAFLNDSEPAVRAEAARNLGVHGGAGAREALEAVLLSDDNAGVRLAAAFWLGGMKSPDSAAALGRALTQDQDPNVRSQAARSLKWLGTGEAKVQLKQGQKDTDKRVRGIANER